MEIIKNRALSPDPWRHLSVEDDVPPKGSVTITLSQFEVDAEDWLSRTEPWGLRLPNDTELTSISRALDAVSLIVVDFPKFTDGRGYSLARQLRRAGYLGELRASGDVLRDQIALMERCGFDAFELKIGKCKRSALHAFGELGPAYQSAADDQAPGWRRAQGDVPEGLV